MRRSPWLNPVTGLLLTIGLTSPVCRAQLPHQDYLTETEANRIRDAENTNQRIHLFLEFAADRLRRFHQQLALPNPGPRHAAILQDLLEAFAACLDDASGRLADGLDRGEDVRKGAEELDKRSREFLTELHRLRQARTQLLLYKDALDDATDAVEDARHAAEKALHSPRPSPQLRP